MTKNNPGKYDCYANAEPDEPMFVLLARDPLAPHLVDVWRYLRAGDFRGAVDALIRADRLWQQRVVHERRKELLPLDSEKSREASACAKAMWDWELNRHIEEVTARLENTVRT